MPTKPPKKLWSFYNKTYFPLKETGNFQAKPMDWPTLHTLGTLAQATKSSTNMFAWTGWVGTSMTSTKKGSEYDMDGHGIQGNYV